MKREEQTSLRSKIRREADENAIIELIKDFDADMHIIDGTLLNYAVLYDKIKVAKYLIKKGADVNALYEGDYTPLMAAVDNSNIDAVKLLLASHAAVNLKDKYGNGALRKAINENNIEIATLLLKAGADPFLKNNTGGNVYEFVKEAGPAEMLNLIEEYKK